MRRDGSSTLVLHLQAPCSECQVVAQNGAEGGARPQIKCNAALTAAPRYVGAGRTRARVEANHTSRRLQAQPHARMQQAAQARVMQVPGCAALERRRAGRPHRGAVRALPASDQKPFSLRPQHGQPLLGAPVY
jgi:hypothetical protein